MRLVVLGIMERWEKWSMRFYKWRTITNHKNNCKSAKAICVLFFFVNSFGCVFRIINSFSDVVQFEIRI